MSDVAISKQHAAVCGRRTQNRIKSFNGWLKIKSLRRRAASHRANGRPACIKAAGRVSFFSGWLPQPQEFISPAVLFAFALALPS
jgi:hypothetical protein